MNHKVKANNEGRVTVMKALLRIDTRNRLGEGIVWIDGDVRQFDRFLCVDIEGRKILGFNVNSASFHSWATPERVGWIIPTTESGRFLAGFQSGFALLRLGETIEVERLIPAFAGRPEMRLNDACADSNGVLWAGSMNNDDEARPDGKLFRFTADGELSTVDDDYCVANGPAISPDNALFLHTDSLRRTIFAFDFDSLASELSNKRVWRVFDDAEGSPDGMCFDASGKLWVAHWGAGLVSQFSAQGELLQRVRLPVSNVTNLAFGGPGLDRLYVTTARAGLDDESLSRQALAGGIFEIVGHGATGLPARRFGLKNSALGGFR
jgi:D-xylonolactonase